jgi:hypothetical protein
MSQVVDYVVSVCVQDIGADVRQRGRAKVTLPMGGRLRVRFHPVGQQTAVVEAEGSFAEVARRMRAEGGYRVEADDLLDDDDEIDESEVR